MTHDHHLHHPRRVRRLLCRGAAAKWKLSGKGIGPERRANGTVGTADRRTAGGSGADKQRLVGAGVEAGGQGQCGAEDVGGSGA